MRRDEIRRVDELAVAKFGLPGIVLMENAARQVADHACRMIEDGPGPGRFAIFCGGGNNGGDGFATARHLSLRGHGVQIITIRPLEEYRGDAAINLHVAQRLGLPIITLCDPVDAMLDGLEPMDVIIDALLGTGLTQSVRGIALKVIRWINQQTARRLAVDLPSGLDCDTGLPLGDAVRAERTVTFHAMKVGLLADAARAYCGSVFVADIGLPGDVQ